MSHADIRAALEAATPGKWDYYRPHPGYRCYMVERVAPEGHLSGDCVAICEDVRAEANAHLIANAPVWLAELLAENELLTVDAERAREQHEARAEAAEQAIQRVRDLAESLKWKRPEISPCAPQFACCGTEAFCDAMKPSSRAVGRIEILRALDGGEQHG